MDALHDFAAWAWARHHNEWSWYIRPLFLIPFCWFAWRRSLAGVGLTLLALATSMFWFPAPAVPSPMAMQLLAAERAYLFGEWTWWKIAVALLIPATFLVYDIAISERARFALPHQPFKRRRDRLVHIAGENSDVEFRHRLGELERAEFQMQIGDHQQTHRGPPTSTRGSAGAGYIGLLRRRNALKKFDDPLGGKNRGARYEGCLKLCNWHCRSPCGHGS